MTGKIAIVIGCLVVLPAVSACGLAYNGMSAEPDLVAMAGREPVTINSTPVNVPTTVEGLTVAVTADPAANEALANLRTSTDQARAASAVGQAGRATSVLRAGRYLVLRTASSTTNRVYVFAASDGISVIAVTTDALAEKEVVAYIAAITS